MLKIYENLLKGTLFEQLQLAQIRSKFKNFCAHQEDKNVQKIFWGQSYGVFKKVVTKVFFTVASYKWPPQIVLMLFLLLLLFFFKFMLWQYNLVTYLRTF